MKTTTAYALRLGDNGLVLSQRLGAWCGHAPELEIDLALANIGLDLLGQARNFLSYAAELSGSGDEDTLAFGRDERQFRKNGTDQWISDVLSCGIMIREVELDKFEEL